MSFASAKTFLVGMITIAAAGAGLSAFFSASNTLIQSAVVAVLFTIGLSIARVPYALAIGVIGGLFNVVPYVGPVITGLLAAAAGLFVGPWTALWAVVIVVSVQQFDSLIMAPRIMSEQVDLHPLLVILSLLVGATLFKVSVALVAPKRLVPFTRHW